MGQFRQLIIKESRKTHLVNLEQSSPVALHFASRQCLIIVNPTHFPGQTCTIIHGHYYLDNCSCRLWISSSSGILYRTSQSHHWVLCQWIYQVSWIYLIHFCQAYRLRFGQLVGSSWGKAHLKQVKHQCHLVSSQQPRIRLQTWRDWDFTKHHGPQNKNRKRWHDQARRHCNCQRISYRR